MPIHQNSKIHNRMLRKIVNKINNNIMNILQINFMEWFIKD